MVGKAGSSSSRLINNKENVDVDDDADSQAGIQRTDPGRNRCRRQQWFRLAAMKFRVPHALGELPCLKLARGRHR